MSQFEIGEARPGRPAKPDPFSGLDDIFTKAQIGAAITVPLRVAEGLTDEQKKRIGQKARAALRRYAKARGGLAGEIGFDILADVVEIYFTKRKARPPRAGEPAQNVTLIGGEPGSLATGEAPYKPKRKGA